MTKPSDRLHRDDHVARWCRTTCVDQDTKWPKLSAFYLREGENDLSTNWLEYYSADHDDAVNSIRDNFLLTLTVGGRFVVLNVGQALDSVANRGVSPCGVLCIYCIMTATQQRDRINPVQSVLIVDKGVPL